LLRESGNGSGDGGNNGGGSGDKDNGGNSNGVEERQQLTNWEYEEMTVLATAKAT
jgi:hypothetical protein